MFKHIRKIGGVDGGVVLSIGTMEVTTYFSLWGGHNPKDLDICMVPRVFNGTGNLCRLLVHAFKEKGGDWVTVQAGRSAGGVYYAHELCAKTEGVPKRRVEEDVFLEMYNEALKRTLEQVIKEL